MQRAASIIHDPSNAEVEELEGIILEISSAVINEVSHIAVILHYINHY